MEVSYDILAGDAFFYILANDSSTNNSLQYFRLHEAGPTIEPARCVDVDRLQ